MPLTATATPIGFCDRCSQPVYEHNPDWLCAECVQPFAPWRIAAAEMQAKLNKPLTDEAYNAILDSAERKHMIDGRHGQDTAWERMTGKEQDRARGVTRRI